MSATPISCRAGRRPTARAGARPGGGWRRSARIGLLRRAVAALCLGLPLATSAEARMRVARVFGDGMVLQRDRPVPVWGWAEPGDTVTVAFAGQTQTARAATNGSWRVLLGAMPASAEPRTLSVLTSATHDMLHLTNVLVGEVWLCAGQSNMGLHLRDCFRAAEEIAAAHHPQLRFLVVPGSGAATPAADLAGGRWQVCTPETAATFAGTAYFFGRALHRELRVPVGLIERDQGATGIECWVPLSAYQASTNPALQALYREAASWDTGSEFGRQAHAEAFARIQSWVPAAKAALAAGRAVPPEPLLPAPSRQVPGPTTVYNGIIHPLTPYPIRGAVWYQGESNGGEGPIYELKMRALIAGWRAAWGEPELPFYYVQLANEGRTVMQPMDEEGASYVPVREAQRRVLALPNTGMAVAIDLGEDANGHPRNKRDVGERLALWALARTYGRAVPFSGPLYRSCRRDGDAMVIAFDHAGSGLMVADKDGLAPVKEVPGGVMRQFALRGADGDWHWADARIAGETVVVRSDRVPSPTAVRYACSLNPKGPKLYSRDGLPASPFRSDEW